VQLKRAHSSTAFMAFGVSEAIFGFDASKQALGVAQWCGDSLQV